VPGQRARELGIVVGSLPGKLIGATQLSELGVIETPIVLTATLSAFRAADALVSYLLALPGNGDLISVNPVVGETNDGFLSDIRARPVTAQHVLAALSGARGGPVAEGNVGAGTGTAALGFKAGIGTASRIAALPGGQRFVLGALVQANFSGCLTVLGVPVRPEGALAGQPGYREGAEPSGNSCMIIVGTDAALDARQLTRAARRAVFALGRVGSDFRHGSGDYAIAFATVRGQAMPDAHLNPVFTAVQECVEEAVLNSLLMAATTAGHLGHIRYAVPHEYLLGACRRAGVLAPVR